MSAATAFPESETRTAEIPQGYHPAPKSAPREPIAPEPESWQETVLDLLAHGASVAVAMRHVGYSAAAFYKTCTRHPEFRVAADRARNAYRAQVAEEFHDAEAYARSLVDSVMRDEQLPASLRLRAALAILNRKRDHWLPMSIPALEETVDTVDSMDIAGTAADNADITDTVEGVDTVDTVDGVDNADTVNNPAEIVYRQFLAEIEAMGSAFHATPQGRHPSEPANTASASENTKDVTDTVDTVDTLDRMNNVDNIDTLDTMDIAGTTGIHTEPHPHPRPSDSITDTSPPHSAANALCTRSLTHRHEQ